MTDTWLLALDPGGTTGWSLGKFSDTKHLVFVDGGQVKNGVAGFVEWFKSAAWSTVADPDGELIIVSERFVLRPSVMSPDVTPLRIEGALSALLGPGGVHYQMPATKALVPDQKLKELGFWIPGQRHHMDARIHALAHMMTMPHIPTLQEYFGEL